DMHAGANRPERYHDGVAGQLLFQGASSLSSVSSGTTSKRGRGRRSIVRRVTPSQPHVRHQRRQANRFTSDRTGERTAIVSEEHFGHSRPAGRNRYSRMKGESSIAAHNTVTNNQNIITSSLPPGFTTCWAAYGYASFLAAGCRCAYRASVRVRWMADDLPCRANIRPPTRRGQGGAR